MARGTGFDLSDDADQKPAAHAELKISRLWPSSPVVVAAVGQAGPGGDEKIAAHCRCPVLSDGSFGSWLAANQLNIFGGEIVHLAPADGRGG